MSLAMYAAPFDNDSSTINNKDSENSIERKKTSHNKTQKRYSNKENSERVNSVLQSIHNLPENDESNGLADFNPPPPPNSAGIERRQNQSLSKNTTPYSENLPEDGHEGYSFSETEFQSKSEEVNMPSNSKIPDNYYQRFMPNYDSMFKSKQYTHIPIQRPNFQTEFTGSSNDVLIQKLNYMINLLEEQKDERTGNVTEEVILYSFLGIFIIFIADTFVKAGKYTR
jgi:hypothetical protein